MKLSSLLAPLLDGKADHETIRKVVLAFEAEQNDALEKRRESDRKRQSDKRSRDITLRHSDRLLVTRVEDSSSKKDITGNKKEDISLEFENEFWPIYPRKVGKGAALKAYIAARKRSSFDAIIAGARRHAAERAGEDAQFTKHPQGWLAGDHWNDEPTPKRVAPQATAPPRETVGSLSKRQLFEPKAQIDVTDYSSRRLENGGPGRLEEGTRSSRPFAITGDEFGRI